MKFLSLLSVLVASAVSAAPVVFNSALLSGSDSRFVSVHHSSVKSSVVSSSVVAPELASLHLVAKLGADFSDGFASGKTGSKALSSLVVEDGEHLVELVGVSDCKSWFGVVLSLWSSAGLHHKGFGAVRNATTAAFAWDALHDHVAVADFVHTHASSLVLSSLKSKLSAHPLFFMLLAKFSL